MDFKFFILFFILFLNFTFLTQAQEVESLEYHPKYNVVVYINLVKVPSSLFGKRIIVAHGNMKNNSKHGSWRYYNFDGTILAQGQFKNGRKVGKWTYNTSEYKTNYIKWKSKNPWHEIIRIENEKTLLIDSLHPGLKYINGVKQSSKARFL